MDYGLANRAYQKNLYKIIETARKVGINDVELKARLKQVQDNQLVDIIDRCLSSCGKPEQAKDGSTRIWQ